MALRPEFTLNHPRYAAFLFAVVGEDHSGMQITVQSALARRDLDPWQEAARLSGLTREAATHALAAAIAELPIGNGGAPDAWSIAVRLLDLLPDGAALSTEAAHGASEERPRHQPWMLSWLVGGAIGIGLVLVIMLLG